MRTIDELRKIRKDRGITYKQLVERSGLSMTTVTNVFCGYVNAPRLDTLQAIEQALGLVPTDEERAAGVVENVTETLTADEAQMLDLFRELGQKRGIAAQAAILTVIENMLQ